MSLSSLRPFRSVAAMLLSLVVSSAAIADSPPASIEILSSAPDQVSDGDALVRIQTPPGILKNVLLQLNGKDVTRFLSSKSWKKPHLGDGEAEGVVEGFEIGDNLLELRHKGSQQVLAELAVVNHPKSGPIFSGPQQQPFVCTTARSGLGQPHVDNQDEFGIPVAEEAPDGSYPSDGRGYPTAGADIIGWSANCAADTVIDYWYRTTGGAFLPLDDPRGPLPDDIDYVTTLTGKFAPYIVRWERGTMNRFIYSVAMLATTREKNPNKPDDRLWNGRLVFSLQGGVAIGRTQGTVSTSARLLHDVLKLGYAVVNSTGLRMNTHYNLELGGETALMLKEHFIEDHGVPLYTVGVGGSGGAIQQYVYAQNHPGLLDAAIPQYSYSDMITQTIHVGDCELLEHFFDSSDRTNARWETAEERRKIQGLNALTTPNMNSASEREQWNLLYFLYGLLGLNAPQPAPGSDVPAITECRRAWFGLTPLTLNPTFTNVSDIDKLAQGTDGVEWTHTGDLVNIYGTGPDGYSRFPWDNVGVQYGLEALNDGSITPLEFLNLNALVGSWKDLADMVPEGFPFVGDDVFDLDPWSSRNMNLSPNGLVPAPRRSGDLQAIAAAYERGMVFQGDIDIPVIDWRHYLEQELDMHHSHQSFATRKRMQNAKGNSDNMVIWFTDGRPERAFDQTPEAFEVIDEWMMNIFANPAGGVAGNKPPRAVDRCFATDGTEIAAGDDVWNGILDDGPPGVCTQAMPVFKSSRIVAGGPIEGGIFKCHLQSVDEAIAKGVYDPWEPAPIAVDRLKQIFPDGVCDWTLGDAGKPAP